MIFCRWAEGQRTALGAFLTDVSSSEAPQPVDTRPPPELLKMYRAHTAKGAEGVGRRFQCAGSALVAQCPFLCAATRCVCDKELMLEHHSIISRSSMII